MVRLEELPLALPLTPALLMMLASLGILMLAVSAKTILPPLLDAFSNLPWPVGPWLHDRAEDVYNWTSGAADSALTNLIQATLDLWSRIEWVNRVIAAAFTETIDDVEWAVEHTVGALLPALRDWADELVSNLQAWAVQQFASLQAWVLNQLGPVPELIQGAISALWAQIVPYINDVAQAVQSADQAAIDALGGYTAAQTAAVLAQAENDILNEAQRAARAEGATLATAQAYSAALQADLSARVFGPGGAVQGLEDELQTGLNGTLAAALAGALALAKPLELTIDNINDSPCMKACDPLGAFGSALETLDLAAIVALVAAAAANPKGTADAVQSLLGPVIDGADTLVESVLGTRH